MPGPEHEEALHGEVGEGDDRHPGREDRLQQTPRLKNQDSVLCVVYSQSRGTVGPR